MTGMTWPTPHPAHTVTGVGRARKVPYSMQMSPAMAARWVIVCALLLGVTGAYAEKRPVAVVNLSDEAPTRSLAYLLDVELSTHPELERLSTEDSGALINYTDDDGPHLDDARASLRRAEDELAGLNFAGAAKQSLEGQHQLLAVTPSAAVRVYADLTLVLGLARLGAHDDQGAAEAFAHVHKLDPTRTLDPAAYVPEIVAAFTAAKTAAAGTGTIEATGAGTLWIDGLEVGVAPGTFAASSGAHVVWLTGMERETRGEGIVVRPGQPTAIEIPAAEATRSKKIQRARLALAHAADATARAAAMRHLADLVMVHDAVLLSMSNAKLIVQTWRDRAPGFSSLRELGKDTPADILAPLAPPKVVKHVDPPPKVLPPLVDKRWYQKTSWRLGIAATVVTGVIAGIVWSQLPDTVVLDMNASFPGAGTITR
jgi:hypothetical protein